MKVGVVMNPAAGGGRLRAAWPGVATALEARFGAVDIRQTDRQGDGIVLGRDLALHGCGLVIAAGGDGTASEVAEGLLQHAEETGRTVELGLLPCGTGVDFARGLRLPRDLAGAVRRIAEATARRVDAGRVSFIDDDGRLATRHFINIGSLGLSGATDRAVNADRRKGRVSGKALFFWRTAVELLRYRFQQVRITVDDGESIEATVALVAVCSGRFFGAGMMIAPDAVVDDGLFDIVILRGASKLRLLGDLRLVYGGRHRTHPAITILRGRKVLVEPIGDVIANGALLDLDGESPGRIPATFEMLPGALMLRY